MGFITIFVFGVLLGALVKWKRNVFLSIILHIQANTLSAGMALMGVLGGI